MKCVFMGSQSRDYQTFENGTILFESAVIVLLGFFLLPSHSLAQQPRMYGDYVNYTLVVDPDFAEQIQIKPATADYEEDALLQRDTRSPAVFVFQDDVLYPEANSGWHYHPGIVLATVVEGVVEWYNGDCEKHVRKSGESFTEADHVLHFVRNVSQAPARIVFTFVVAKGQTNKSYNPAPACAKPLGLDRPRFPTLKKPAETAR
jgi:hypothetical protein